MNLLDTIKSNKITFTIVFCIIIAIIIIISIVSTREKPACQAQLNEPQRLNDPIDNFITETFDAIANFDGYLLYQNFSKVPELNEYVPLELKDISLNRTSKGQYLTLNCNCGSIGVSWLKKPKSSHTIDQLDINIKVANKLNAICHITYPGPYLNDDEHYICKEKYTYDCIDGSGKKIVSLVIFSIEFEIDGEPDWTKRHIFSKRRRQCD